MFCWVCSRRGNLQFVRRDEWMIGNSHQSFLDKTWSWVRINLRRNREFSGFINQIWKKFRPNENAKPIFSSSIEFACVSCQLRSGIWNLWSSLKRFLTMFINKQETKEMIGSGSHRAWRVQWRHQNRNCIQTRKIPVWKLTWWMCNCSYSALSCLVS